MKKIFELNNRAFTFDYEENVDIRFSVKEENDGVILYRVSFEWEELCAPKKITLSYSIPCVDTYTMWDPIEKLRFIPFGDRQLTDSRLASGMPLKGLVSSTGKNRYLSAVSDVKSPIVQRMRASITGATVDCFIDFFTQMTGPFKSYEAEIRIDTRDIPFDCALYGARAWFDGLGYENAYVPEDAKYPMYSTWYSYGQAVTEGDVIAECEKAAELGMKAVILDDGWQTDDLSTIYGYCGDWKPVERKFPDMRAFSDRIHALGMKLMVWFSVPFIGKFSENCKTFEGKYLCYFDNTDCYALDPRFKEVREFLVNTYVKAVKDWQLDGLKLDFIDRFKANGEYSDEMDFVSVEDAVEQLLREVSSALRAINPEILIEFRQPYFGPVVSAYGNMMRVWDCPLDGRMNKNQTLNLRLVSGSCAVHSDMIYWNREDTPEGVAVQLFGTVFSVPQISARLGNITDEQRAVLKNYLDFWNEHRKTLSESQIRVGFIENGYSYAQAEGEDGIITLLCASPVAELTKAKKSYFVNLTADQSLIIKNKTGKKLSVRIVDCKGAELANNTYDAELFEVGAPTGSLTEVCFA